ncbi:unnamed protein product [Malus baccata var. baccata]
MSLETGAGVILCIEKALEQSGVSREDVNYINAHATSAPGGDLKEYNALIHCFGQNPELESELCKVHDWSPTGSIWCCRKTPRSNSDVELLQ